jgi:peptidyl-prolyl cis-trans isomerase D
MLKTMRNSFHHLKWTLFLVIAVFILGFVFWSGSSSDPNKAGQVVARVGTDRITAVDFDRQYRAQVERYRQMYQGNFSPELERALDLPRNVLDSMIERMLRLEAARRLDLHVSDPELAQKIVSLPFFQDNGQFIGRDKYEKMLRSNGIQPDRFEDELREDMLLEKYASLVKASVVVPDTDLAREFAARNDKATIEYVLVPAARLESAAQPSDADLQAYLDKHKDRYRAPIQRKTKYLLIDRARVRTKMTPSDPEVRAAYEQRKDTFAAPEQVNAAHILIKSDGSPESDAQARARAEALASRAKAPGADFAKLANENTDDPSGKTTGGKLPPFSHGQMVPEFENAAFSMQPGEIRGPVKTQFGYHIIKVDSKTPARQRAFEEVRAALVADLAEKQAAAEVDRLSSELSEKLKGMRSASDDELRNLQKPDAIYYNTTEWSARGDTIPGIGNNQKFADEAWTTPLGKISSVPVPTARGIVFVRPTEERAAGVPPFAELKAKLETDWKAERREKDALAQLEPVSRELASGTTLAALASRYGTEVKTTTEFGPNGPVPEVGTAPELAAAVFRTAQGQAGPPVAVPNGFVLFRVLTRAEGNKTTFEAQKDDLRESIRTREAERLTRSYLAQLRSTRDVEVNEALLSSFLRDTGSNRRS